MSAVQNISCEFAQYAYGLNLSSDKDREDLAGVLSKSFTCISNCAGDKTWIVASAVRKLCKIVFDTKTHTLALQPTPSFISTVLPSKTWTLLGYEEEIAGPRNLEGMMLFVAEKLSKLVKLKFGPTDNDTFTQYLLVNYKNVHMGMIYLKEYYRRFVSVPSNDHEEKTLERCLNIHDSITASAAFIDGYSTEEIFKLTDSVFLEISKVNALLSLEINAPIKNIMTLGTQNSHKAYIKKVFKNGKDLTFMIYCLKMDAELFPQILVPLSNDLEQAYKNRFNSSNPHLEEFYLKILNNEYFKILHLDIVVQLLKEKKLNESEEEFQIRCQSKPVKEALNYICQEIEQIKKRPLSEVEQKKQLAIFLKAMDKNLREFSPFKQIFNFLVDSNQTPPNNYPGLPFKYLGNHRVNKFVAQVLFSFDNPEALDLSDSACRKKLLECAEHIIEKKFSEALESDNSSIDLDKLNNWLTLFPEVNQLPCWPIVEKFCKTNNIKIPFQT